MKKLIIPMLLSLVFIKCQKADVRGEYANYFGKHLTINADSTFKYKWQMGASRADGRGWATGTWKIKRDTIYFEIKPVYDTLRTRNKQRQITDTMLLSIDDKPHLSSYGIDVTAELHRENTNCGKQDLKSMPSKLYFDENRLYEIGENGSLITAKRKYAPAGKHLFDPWYSKVDGACQPKKN